MEACPDIMNVVKSKDIFLEWESGTMQYDGMVSVMAEQMMIRK